MTIQIKIENEEQIGLSIAAIQKAIDSKDIPIIYQAPLFGIKSILEQIRDATKGHATSATRV